MTRRARGELSERDKCCAILLIGTVACCAPRAFGSSAVEPPETSWPPITFEAPGRFEPRPEPLRIALEVPGFLPAVLVVPTGTEPRPLVFAAHGAGGAPEQDCEYWNHLIGERAFVLCPRGTAMGAGAFYFEQHHALAAELVASVAAAHEQFPRIARTSGIYAGFSQGASMGALMISKHAEQFPYVVLIEGFTQWNIALGRAFKSHGGEAVLFACGSRECATTATASTLALQRAGVRARPDHAAGSGHTASGAVMDLVARGLPWLLGNDPLWAR